VERLQGKDNNVDHQVDHLLQAEKERLLQPGLLVEQLDFPEFKEKHPELRAALLKKLKELGRVPQDKE
jgi:hypothetical protein